MRLAMHANTTPRTATHDAASRSTGCACGARSRPTPRQLAFGGIGLAPCARRGRLAGVVRALGGEGGVAVNELPGVMVADFSAVQNPQRHHMTYSNAVKAFVKNAVLAYECGYSEETVLHNLAPSLGGEERVEDSLCWRFISLVWVTLSISPVRVRRWTTGPAVSEQTTAYWRGFVGMIVSAYFEKRMSWFPTDRLMLERSFTTGAPQKPELVAESARIVFTTLEVIAPQFPSM